MSDAALARFRRVAVEAFDLALALPDLPTRLRELADWVDTMPSCLRSAVTKAPEMGGGSAKREADPEVALLSLPVSPSRPAVEKEEAFTEDELPTGEVERAKAAAGRADAPRLNAHGDRRGMAGGRKARDFTGLKLGTFVGVERVGSDRNGSPLWFFRCEVCKETKTWSAARIAQALHGHKPPPGKGHECPKAPAIDAPKPAPEPAANLDGEESGPVSLTAEEAALVRPPACPSCRLRGGKSEAPEEGEEAAE